MLAMVALTAVLAVLDVSTLVAQGPVAVEAGSDTVEVVLWDGSRLYGTVEREIEGGLRLRLLSGDVVELRSDRIQTLGPLTGRLVNGRVWQEDPNTTRLFFGPTARTLERGSGYFSVYELVMPFVAVGVHDRVTLAAGTPLIFGGGESERLFWFAPKVQVAQTEDFAAAVGVLHFWIAGKDRYEYQCYDPEYCTGEPERDPSHYGVAYGVVTFGAPDASATLGAGMGYSGADLEKEPVFMLGAESRTSRFMKFVTENYFFPGEGMGLISAGPRFFGENLTADLGMMVPIMRGEGFVAFPLVSFVYNW